MAHAETETHTDLEIDFPSLWGAKFHNDDYTPMDFVVAVMTQIFALDEATANRTMLAVHNQGSSIVGAYTRDIAETKVASAMKAAKNYGHPMIIEAVEL